MTVSSTTVAVVYSGNGSTTVFSVTFPFYEISVYEISAAGAITAKSVGTHYTLTGGSGATGTLTMLVAPASGARLVIERATSRLQAVDYSEGDDFSAETNEKALDRLAMVNAEQDAWMAAPIIPSFTAANIASAAHAVNTTGKRAGRLVYDTTNTRIMVANGALATSTWSVVDNSATVTPS